MKKLRDGFRNWLKREISGQVLYLVAALLFWQERKMGHGNFVLIIGNLTKLLWKMDIQFLELMIFWINLGRLSSLQTLTWNLDINKYQLIQKMYGRLHSSPRKVFLNGWLCLLALKILLLHLWGWWMMCLDNSLILLLFFIWMISSFLAKLGLNICNMLNMCFWVCKNITFVPT